MPLYEYQCTRCGHQFEVVHSVSESVDRCERCGAPVRRVFSPVGIIFKGSGFHVTDYRKTPASTDGDGKAAEKTPTTEKTPAKAKAAKDSGGSSSASSSSA